MANERRNKMKEMVYQQQGIMGGEILDSGEIDGYKYKIVSYGIHPCAYVCLPKNDKFYGLPYDEIDIDCHGGLTYGSFQQNEFWIGWDYAHWGDYCGYHALFDFDSEFVEKRWTTAEILEEVKDVIKQLCEANKEQK